MQEILKGLTPGAADTAVLDHWEKLCSGDLTSDFLTCRAMGITVSLSAHACSEAEISRRLSAQGISILKGKRRFGGSCWGRLTVETKEGKRKVRLVVIDD